MGRRSSKSDTESADGRPVALERDALDAAGQEGGLEDRWAQWEEKWDRLEEERVARWLKAKVHPEAEIDLRDQPDGPLGADRWQGETAVSFLDEQRRRMTATIEAQRIKAERVRWQREVKIRGEAERSELDQERVRLAADVDAERLEAERRHNEQHEVRAGLETEMSQLDEGTQRLAAAVEAKRAEAERVQREQQEVRIRLETELPALDEQRLSFLASVDAELEEAERLHGELGKQPEDDGNTRVEDWRTAEEPPRPHSKRATRRLARLLPGWLIMTALALGPVGLVAFEVTSPLVVRSLLEGVARDAADGAVTELLDHNDLQRARLAAEAIAEDEDAVVTSLTVDQRGLRVVIEREAQSLLLKHLDRTASWYNVEVTATAATARN